MQYCVIKCASRNDGKTQPRFYLVQDIEFSNVDSDLLIQTQKPNINIMN